MRAATLFALVIALAAGSARAADLICQQNPGHTCSDQVCQRTETILCDDWNDPNDWDSVTGHFDEFVTISNGSHLDRKGGTYGDLEAGVGHNGTAGWRYHIAAEFDETLYWDSPAWTPETTGPLYLRFYLKFSPDYRFMMACGLQKLIYLWQDGHAQRIMLGVNRISDLGPAWVSSQCPARGQTRTEDLGRQCTIGVLGFDGFVTTTHSYIALPDQQGDNPIPIYGGVEYLVEMMADVSTRTVQIWVDGALQMTRTNLESHGWTDTNGFNQFQMTAWNGGGAPFCQRNLQAQEVYQDEHVVSTGRIGAFDPGEPTYDFERTCP